MLTDPLRLAVLCSKRAPGGARAVEALEHITARKAVA